jgi:hypothetical protein
MRFVAGFALGGLVAVVVFVLYVGREIDRQLAEL